MTLLCHFFTLMLLARLLDKQAMGVYFIAIMVTFLLKLLSDMGVDLAFVKQYPEHPPGGRNSLLLGAIFTRTAACALVTAIYLWVESTKLVSFINDISHVTGLTLALYWMHSFRELLLRLLQAEQRFTVYAGVQVLAAALKALLILALVLTNTVDVRMVLLVEIAAFVVSIFYGCLQVREQLFAALRTSAHGISDLLRFGYPLYLNALLNLGNERVSQYIVAQFGGPLTMAYFGMSERLADAGTRLFEAFANVYYPKQTQYFADNQAHTATAFADRSILWTGFVICSAIVSFTILREPVIELFFTAEYLSVANAAALFFVVLLLRSTQTIMGYFGVAAGQKFLPVKVSTISSVINIALCYYWFQRYGYQGAIAALVVTQLVMNLLYYGWLRKAGFRINLNPLLTMVALTVLCVALIFAANQRFMLTLVIFPVFLALCFASLPALRSDCKELTEIIQGRLKQGSNVQ